MTIFEYTNNNVSPESVERLQVLTPQERATELSEHWYRFAKRKEPRFLAYFMLEHPDHEDMRKEFIKRIKASPELPYPTKETVLKTGRAVLWAVSNTYEDGEPYDVTYLGEHPTYPKGLVSSLGLLLPDALDQ